MSKLELLARQRAQKKKEVVNNDDSSPKYGFSLLSKLNGTNVSTVKPEEIRPLTLAQKLAALKVKKAQNKDKNDTSKQIQQQKTISAQNLTPQPLTFKEKLRNLNQNTISDVKPSLTLRLNNVLIKSNKLELEDSSYKQIGSDKSNTSIPNDHTIGSKRNQSEYQESAKVWEYIRNNQKSFEFVDIQRYDVSEIMELLQKEDVLNDLCMKKQKKNYEEIFTVFYPDKKLNTNNDNGTVHDKAIANFKKPSPDDMVLEAQANVFDDVKNSISNLEISKNTTDLSLLNEDEDNSKYLDEPVVKTYKKVTSPTKPRNPVNIEEYVSNMKPHCTFVVLGHVDAGKSTLMGRLLYDIGAVDSNHIRKLKRESERIGKGSFHLAWVMDQTTEERERGVTVSICTSDFETKKAKFTIVDAPGHRDFVPNAIAGISQADAAVLTIDCGIDAFESGFNLDGQTKEHALLARSLGVSHLVIAMNKMDSVDWNETRFLEIKNELLIFFDDIGYKSNQLSWVPCSGLSGEGVHEIPYPDSQTWYKGLSLISELEIACHRVCTVSYDEISNQPFIFSILEVISSNNHEEANISGRVESGSIQPGETVTIYPSEQSVLVDKIIVGNDNAPASIAIKNDFVTLKLRHVHAEDIEAGDLVAAVEYKIPPSQNFNINILTFKLDRPLLPGTSFMMFRGVCQQPARINKLVSLVDKNDPYKIIKKKVKHLGSNQSAIVEVELIEKKRWIPLLSFKENRHLGRIVLRKDGRTIGAGIIAP